MAKNQIRQENQRLRSLKISFADLQKKLEELKSILKEVSISPGVIEEIRVAREKLHQLFSQPRYVKLCRNCKRGYCCMSDYGEHLLPGELIYLAVIDYNFPEPDWGFLEREIWLGRPRCLFCSSAGCLLKENRRLICLRYVCDDLERKLEKENQFPYFYELIKNRAHAATNALNAEALEKLGLRIDDMD